MQRGLWGFAIAFLAIFLGVMLSGATEVSIFGVNITDSRTPTSILSIQVSDYVSFGNISEGGISEEIKIDVNNTGNTGINVRPMLNNVSDVIMKNLYLRELKTSGGEPVPFQKIGEFSFNITAPTSGGVRQDYFYAVLNLSDVNVAGDLLNYEAEIRYDIVGI